MKLSYSDPEDIGGIHDLLLDLLGKYSLKECKIHGVVTPVKVHCKGAPLSVILVT